MDNWEGDFGYFDPETPVGRLCGNLPHWRQEGVMYFVTFRLADSLPQEKLAQWTREREAWLAAHPEPDTVELRREFHTRFTDRFQRWLDAGYGACVLAQPSIKKLVEGALRFFDGKRYTLDEFVVMPNHVHALVAPMGVHELANILHSWKSYTSHEINRRLRTNGNNWQQESFDHIVRNAESLERIRQYIKDNPRGAGQ